MCAHVNVFIRVCVCVNTHVKSFIVGISSHDYGG